MRLRGRRRKERDETSRLRPGTGRPSYGKELLPALDGKADAGGFVERFLVFLLRI